MAWLTEAGKSVEASARARDMLPCPTGAMLDVFLRGRAAPGASISQVRRGRRREHENNWLKRGIDTLNRLGGQGRSVRSDAPLNAAQVSGVAHLISHYGSIGSRPDGFSPPEAYRALRGDQTGYSQDGGGVDPVGALAVYRRDGVALPAGHAGDVSLHDSLPPRLAALLVPDGDFLGDASVAEEAVAGANISLASDPYLSSHPFERGRLLSELVSRGVLECGSVSASTGIFFVRKKNNDLRLIFDTRITNLFLKTPIIRALATVKR